MQTHLKYSSVQNLYITDCPRKLGTANIKYKSQRPMTSVVLIIIQDISAMPLWMPGQLNVSLINHECPTSSRILRGFIYNGCLYYKEIELRS